FHATYTRAVSIGEHQSLATALRLPACQHIECFCIKRDLARPLALGSLARHRYYLGPEVDRRPLHAGELAVTHSGIPTDQHHRREVIWKFLLRPFPEELVAAFPAPVVRAHALAPGSVVTIG